MADFDPSDHNRPGVVSGRTDENSCKSDSFEARLRRAIERNKEALTLLAVND